MIHGIKLKIKIQRDMLRVEEAKDPKKKDHHKILSLKYGIRSKKKQIRKLKQKKVKRKK